MPDTQDNMIGPVTLGFTTVTLKILLDERAAADARLQAERDRRYDEREAATARLLAERDRRYAEIATLKSEALKIKETADLTALGLQRDNQIYKDEKANELREQISSERGLYATKGDLIAAVEKIEATIKPIADTVSAMQGRGAGLQAGWGYLVAGVGLFLTLLTIGSVIFALSR